jgi:hypothetical protein
MGVRHDAEDDYFCLRPANLMTLGLHSDEMTEIGGRLPLITESPDLRRDFH